MKKLILILTLLIVGLLASSQTLIHTDTITTELGIIKYKWYHLSFIDMDGATVGKFTLKSNIRLKKEYVLSDTTYTIRSKDYRKSMEDQDSIKNPYGSNYYLAPFVKNIIYSTDESMKRTLTLFWILNEHKRILQ